MKYSNKWILVILVQESQLLISKTKVRKQTSNCEWRLSQTADSRLNDHGPMIFLPRNTVGPRLISLETTLNLESQMLEIQTYNQLFTYIEMLINISWKSFNRIGINSKLYNIYIKQTGWSPNNTQATSPKNVHINFSFWILTNSRLPNVAISEKVFNYWSEFKFFTKKRFVSPCFQRIKLY